MSGSNTDILIIGGGVIGLSIARALGRVSDRRITVIDGSKAGREASWAAAGMLSPNAEPHSDPAMQLLCTRSNDLYPAFVRELEEETGISVGFERNGTLEVAEAEDAGHLQAKYQRLKTAGCEAEMIDAGDLERLEPACKAAGPAILFPSDGQVDNRRLVSALTASAKIRNIDLKEGVEAFRLTTAKGRVTGAETSHGIIAAEMVVVAAGAWAAHFAGTSSRTATIRPIRGQMLAFQTPQRPMKRVIYGPDVYLVGREDGRVLAGATVEDAGFAKELRPEAISALRERSIAIFPDLALRPVISAWAGLRPMAADGLPVLGPCSEADGLMIAGGHFRNGILLAPLTGELIADAILKDELSPLLTPFLPDAQRAAVFNK